MGAPHLNPTLIIVFFEPRNFWSTSKPKPQGSDRFEYKVMGSMLELYCDAVVDLLSKGASPEAHSLQKWRNTQLVDFCVMFFGLHDSWFLRKFLGLNTVLHKKNIFKKINLKSSRASASSVRHFHILYFPPTPNKKRCHRRPRTKTSVTQRSRQSSRDPGDKKKAKLNIRQEKNGNVWGTQLSNEQRVPGCLGYFLGMKTSQLCWGIMS